MTEPKQTTLAEIKATPKPAAELVPGFFSAQGMSLLEQAAGMLTHSDMVPVQYRTEYTKNGKTVRNESGFANCIVAVNMAHSIGLDPLMVMQNLHVIEGKPSWSASFLISRINASGAFTRLAFDISDPGEEVTVEYAAYEGWGQDRRQVKKSATVRHQTCRAWAKDRETGEVLKGTEISVKMAIAEGWAKKDGSKWHTMQEQMLMYRAASFWCRIHAPELLHGLPTDDELRDTIEAEIVGDVMQAKPMTTDDLKNPAGGTQRKAKVDAEDATLNGEASSRIPDAATDGAEAAQPAQDVQPTQDQPRQRRTRQAAFNAE